MEKKAKDFVLEANNKKAYFDYFIEDKYEAGIVLTGDEIKSIRAGHISINESFVYVKDGEVWLKNAYIKLYDKGYNSSRKKTNERVDRKLLLHKKEIVKIQKDIQQEGLTIVPTKVYFEGSLVKVEIAIAKGKKLYDKRETKKKQDEERRISRED